MKLSLFIVALCAASAVYGKPERRLIQRLAISKQSGSQSVGLRLFNTLVRMFLRSPLGTGLLPAVNLANECSRPAVKKSVFDCSANPDWFQVGSSCYHIPNWIDADDQPIESVFRTAEGTVSYCQDAAPPAANGHPLVINNYKENDAVFPELMGRTCRNTGDMTMCAPGYADQYVAEMSGGYGSEPGKSFINYRTQCAGPGLVQFQIDPEIDTMPCNIVYAGDTEDFQRLLEQDDQLTGGNCAHAMLLPVCEVDLDGNPGQWEEIFIQH